ncbi:MAG: SIMPL domain-containing protein [Muribaculaceae bacterium]|jgi:Uncharacterized conserved protein|nr:SIMPL domain-containing protein [Muribaculaceae bacterium]
MKKISLIIMSVCAFIPSLFAQSVISVSGKSEMSITPDEVHLLLTEKEYHSIDFKGKVFIDYGDYSSNINFNQSLYESTLPDDKFQFTVSDKVYEGKKKDIKYTLVDINTLEDRLIRAAVKSGISKDNIKITDIGDYWRWRNGPFLVSRQYDLKITDPVQLNKFISSLDKQGVTSISFGELKNKDMEQYDRKGRIQALENARDKATYMVQTYNGTLGSPKSIDDGNMPIVTSPMIQPRMFKSAAITEMADEAGNFDAGSGTLESLDTFPVIRKTYTVNVVFDVNY